MLALRAQLRATDWFTQQNIPEPNLAELLDLVALGTVADVVALDGNNRILVHQGLQRIRAGRCRPGIQALIEVANRDPQKIVTSDLGFALALELMPQVVLMIWLLVLSYSYVTTFNLLVVWLPNLMG